MAEGADAKPRPRPLFASAETISQLFKNNDEKGEVKVKNSTLTETNNLESLNLASSTLDAILAVQQIPKPELQITQYESENSSSEHDGKTLPVVGSRSEDDDIPSSSYQSTSKKRKRSRERRKHKKKKKHKHKKYRERSPSSSPERSANVELHSEKLLFENAANLKPQNSFQVDRKANKDLRTYESVSKLHIAQYKLACTDCVGNPNVSVDFHSRDSNKKDQKKKWKLTRYFGKDSLRRTRKRGSTCRLNHGSSKTTISHQPEFINLPNEMEENRNTNAMGSYSCLDEATSLYVQGKGMQTSKPEASDDFVREEIFEKVARFNQRTREDPHNVVLWLEFLSFQDVVAMEDKSFKKQSLHLYDVYRPSRSVIEKKLSILEKAIELNPSSLQLKQTQLELYQDIWESEKVEKAWEDLLFVHSSNVDLWRHYLSRQQSRLSTFSFSKVLKKYHKCFHTLIPILDGQVKVVDKPGDLEEKLLGLFHQYCRFMHQSGYSERAVTSFQAMIEMNLFCPPELNLSSSKERRGKMESFWDSTSPKFGDRNARGWTEWEKNGGEGSKDVGFLPVSTEQVEDSILSTNLSKSLTWIKMEKARCNVIWLPWKPDESKGETEDNCEDPDRLVLFEDISPALFRLTKSQSCIHLVCLFLSFLGMNSTKMENILTRVNGIQKSIFRGYLMDQLYQVQSSSFLKLSLDVGSNWTPHPSLVDLIKQVVLQAESYFGSSNRVIFTMLRLDIELQKNGSTNIQAMSSSHSKDIKKLGKSLLKESQNRNNLVVWDAYIRLLWVLSDKMEETVSMIDTALGMFISSNSLSDPKKAKGICLLCRTFAEIMLNFEPLEHVTIKGRHTAPSVDDKNQVISCMGALFECTKFKPHSKVDSSPLYILRIRKRAVKILETFLSDLEKNSLSSTCDTIVAFLQCYVLFEYCASNFKSANDIFITSRSQIKNLFSKDPSTKSHEIESLLKDLYVSQISFISNAMHVESLPLCHMRDVLDKALDEFPDCSHFHRTFLEVESGSFLAGRLRKFYDKQLKASASVSNVVFAVLSELSRLEKLTQEEMLQSGVSDSGLVNRIRSLFEHSLEMPVCAHCPLLWRMWLAFEVQHGTTARAKGILYRALQSCPWAKSIYMDGIEYFGDEELQEMSDLMTEKEIRVCMPLEEVDLLMNAERESGGEGDDDADNVNDTV